MLLLNIDNIFITRRPMIYRLYATLAEFMLISGYKYQGVTVKVSKPVTLFNFRVRFFVGMDF